MKRRRDRTEFHATAFRVGKLFVVRVDELPGFRIPVPHRWQIRRRTLAAVAIEVGRQRHEVTVSIAVGNTTRTVDHSGWG